MAVKTKQEPQQPLILRAHRLMEAFAKSDDERDFYIDRVEGFIIYVDLDKSQSELDNLESELAKHPERYCAIPKLTFYEAKKIMEGFVNEKVYDIDTKEKLLDIIQSKEARSNFLEFLYDHHAELDKWQQYYQERSRIRIIEWLRQQHFHFVFEEDLEFTRSLLEKLKQNLFESRAGKDILAARKILIAKAKSYYSTEALNPRPKRGRPPKQAAKQEIEPQITSDIYITVASQVRPFLFTPDISSASAVTFSSDFESQGMLASRRQPAFADSDTSLASLQQKLAALRQISTRWQEPEKEELALDFNTDDEDEEELISNKGSKKRTIAKAKTGKVRLDRKESVKKVKKKPVKPKAPSKQPAKKSSVSTRKKPLRPLVRTKNAKLKEEKKTTPKRIISTQKVVSKAKTLQVKAKPKAPLKKRIVKPNKSKSNAKR